MPPNYADKTLEAYDTNYAWTPTDAVAALFDLARTTRKRLPEVKVPLLIMHSRKDTTILPESAEIIYREVSTPPEQKRIVWFDVTEHEMFRDCESDACIGAVVEHVEERLSLRVPERRAAAMPLAGNSD
jgi:carboxylesterase